MTSLIEFMHDRQHFVFRRVCVTIHWHDIFHFSEGRIKQEDIEEAVRWFDCKVEQVDVYICGPGPMIDGMCLTLTRAGLPASSVHFERWW